MFSIILRRLQKYVWAIKIFFLIPCSYGLYFLVFNTIPQISNILIFSFLLWWELLLLLSFFLQGKLSFLIATLAAFLLFLKAVDLLSPLNLGLLGIFVILLGLYVYQPGQKKSSTGEKNQILYPTKPLFPKGWLKGGPKR